MAKLLLSNGKFTEIDDEDFEYFNQWNWWERNTRNTRDGSHYVGRDEQKGVTIWLHHEVLKRNNIIIPCGMIPDHKDRNTFNNKFNNLRVITHSQNKHNQNLYYNNTSGHKGVNYNTRMNKWVARITIKKHRIFLGSFSTFEEAVAARLQAEEKYKQEINLP